MAAAERASPFRRVVANTVSLSAAEFVGRLFSFFAVVHLSRVLLPAGLGVLDLGIALFALVQQASQGGAEVLATRQVARSEAGVRRLAGTYLAVSWLYFAGFGLLLAGAWAAWGGAIPGRSLLFTLAACLTPLGMHFAFWGRERLGVSALAHAGSLALFLVLCLSLADSPADLVWLPLIWISVEAARVLPMLAVFRRRYGAVRFAFHASALRVWMAKAFPVSLSRVARGALFSLDILLLGILATPAAVGIYGAALRIPHFAALIASKLTAASFPTVVRGVAARDSSRLRLIHGELVQVVVGTGLPMVLALSLVSDTLMTLLFGEAFRDSGPLLRILIWKALLMAVGGLYRNAVLARQPGLEMRVTLVGLAATAASLLALVPAFGAIGAAFGTLLGQAFLLVGYALAARRQVAPLPRLGAAWLARLAAGLALVAMAWRMVAGEGELARVCAVLASGGIAVLLVDLPVAQRLRRELSRSSR